MGYYSNDWAPYVPVAERKAKATKLANSMKKKGQKLNPIVIEGRTIGKSFWAKAWCDHLEKFSDYVNRLPRGRTYVRNGSVIDLQVVKGQVNALVMGSELYKVTVDITPMVQSKWQTLVQQCAGKIDSLIELIKGKFSKAVMEIITHRDEGLFPKPKEIKMKCSCPDSATMCKHVAAVLYGVGASLDNFPEWLFTLRHVNHADLIATASSTGALFKDKSSAHAVKEEDLSALFGIEMENDVKTTVVKKAPAKTKAPTKPKAPVKPAKVTKKKIVTKKAEVPPVKLPKRRIMK